MSKKDHAKCDIDSAKQNLDSAKQGLELFSKKMLKNDLDKYNLVKTMLSILYVDMTQVSRIYKRRGKVRSRTILSKSYSDMMVISRI